MLGHFFVEIAEELEGDNFTEFFSKFLAIDHETDRSFWKGEKMSLRLLTRDRNSYKKEEGLLFN